MTEYLRVLPNPDLTVHRPQHVYETVGYCPLYGTSDFDTSEAAHLPGFPDVEPRHVVCQLTTNTNESQLWCEECASVSEWTALRKSFQAMGVRFATVWQDTGEINMATGQVESDPRKFREHLKVASEVMGERLGMKVDYQPTDPTDKDALGVTDEGMDSTHDVAVKEGRKDSRGRFVWQV